MLKQQTEVLELSFDYFNEKLFNSLLPQAMITIQSRGKDNCFGWCSVDPIWYTGESGTDIEQSTENFYEINFSAEYLNRKFEDIMETLIHEMVHLSNITQGIDDCSKKQFHNENFKNEAERVGLRVEKVKRYGWTDTHLTEELIKLVDELKVPKDIFVFARIDKAIKKVTKQNTKIKLVCPKCKNKITAEDEINVICKDCDCEYVICHGKEKGKGNKENEK